MGLVCLDRVYRVYAVYSVFRVYRVLGFWPCQAEMNFVHAPVC